MRVSVSGGPRSPSIAGLRPRRPTILLVDDDDNARRSLKCALEAAGFRVVEARGGGQALRRMSTWLAGGIDMLISEVAIAPPNGVAVAEAIHACWPRATVLLMSDAVIAALTQFPRAQTVRRVLRRPVPGELVEAARRALDTR